MRFKIVMAPKTASPVIPINYQYPLSAAIYRILAKADAEYATFLHEKGLCNKNKYFCYKRGTRTVRADMEIEERANRKLKPKNYSSGFFSIFFNAIRNSSFSMGLEVFSNFFHTSFESLPSKGLDILVDTNRFSTAIRFQFLDEAIYFPNSNILIPFQKSVFFLQKNISISVKVAILACKLCITTSSSVLKAYLMACDMLLKPTKKKMAHPGALFCGSIYNC